MTDPLIELEGLSVRFPGATSPAITGLDLTIRPGECVALVGESGSGKTTTARALLGLTDPGAEVRATRFRVDGLDALGWAERDWRRIRGRFAGLVLQDALVSLDPLRSVRQEVTESVRAGRASGRASRATTREDVLALLESVGFPDPGHRARQYAHQLSGGLRQRALIASALGGRPRLLVADEPTTALDVTVQRQVLDLLQREREHGLGILLVSHDLAVVADIADHVLVLHGGRVVEQGAPAVLLDRPAEAYTRELVAAIPRRGGRREPTIGSPGDAVVLEAQGVSVSYRHPAGGANDRFVALDDVSVRIRQGRTLGIVGESGSGKSTLLRALLATQTPDAGRVLLDGQPWSGIPERARRDRRRRIQVVPQDPLSSFDPRYTVRQIVAEALPRGTGRTAAVDALAAVSLPAELLDRHPLQLSGGQRQRVAIARALAAQPEILLCDEVLSALDVLVQAQILALLGRIKAERGITIVFVSHDLGVVRQVSDDVIVLRAGRIVEAGAAEEVYEHPRHPYTRALLAALPRALGAR
ncbi:MAG: ABC transporter ATP-binding protein [Microbacteriaceae bacterium]